jgi:predicted ATPase/DNA-binding CsgD family transcriptional regulator
MTTATDNLPADMTSFVDRRADITGVRQMLPATRLVTLTGVGGVGKTRLALQVGRDVRRAFADGVFFVELAALKDPSLLPHAVIATLGVPERSSRPPMTVLSGYLRHLQLLLIMDNCEHLLEACAELADTLLRAAPDLRIVATSRQAFSIAGEQVHQVGTLPVPDSEAQVAAGGTTTYPALTLFADRAAAVVPGFTINPQNESAVIRLCQRLEGIPLAIELATVRLRVLTVDELATRLESRLKVLTTGSRTASARQQTLAATLDWSFGLCTPAEQALWARITVFAGGFTLEAVESICTDETLPREAILDTVAGLTDKSILTRQEGGHTARFRLLETIQEYGQAHLRESGEEHEFRRRHRDWYLHFVERAAAEWFGPLQEELATRLQHEHANLRMALEFCLSQPDEVRTGMRMAGLPWYRRLAMGSITEARHWLHRALASDTEPSVERARALCTDGLIATHQGDPSARAILEESHSLALQLEDHAALLTSVEALGIHALHNGDPSSAVELFEECLRRYDATLETDFGDDYLVGLRISLATAYIHQERLDQAFRLLQDVRVHCEQHGEHWLLSYAMKGIGFVNFARGELDQAEADLCEALRLKRPFRDTLGVADAVDVLAWTTVAKGEGQRAAELLGGAAQLWRSLGAQLFGSKELIMRREQFEHEARRLIGDQAFDAAFARGSDLAMEEIIAFALREPGSPTPAPSRNSPTTLTRREREIAELVAGGLSNKEIAAHLVISPRTAEAHVEHILTKLGFNSRAQIATWVAELRTATASD